jgi:hypothetical protein
MTRRTTVHIAGVALLVLIIVSAVVGAYLLIKYLNPPPVEGGAAYAATPHPLAAALAGYSGS